MWPVMSSTVRLWTHLIPSLPYLRHFQIFKARCTGEQSYLVASSMPFWSLPDTKMCSGSGVSTMPPPRPRSTTVVPVDCAMWLKNESPVLPPHNLNGSQAQSRRQQIPHLSWQQHPWESLVVDSMLIVMSRVLR